MELTSLLGSHVAQLWEDRTGRTTQLSTATVSEPRCGANTMLAVATMDPSVGPATVDRDFIHLFV